MIKDPLVNEGWVQTYTGGRFTYGDIKPENICIEDIAHALSLICRFAGHVKTFYSVAQHSVLVSHIVSPEFALWGLLHDASEGATLTDLPSPFKRLPDMKPYRDLERKVQNMIYLKYGLDPSPYPERGEPEEVKEADLIALSTEYRDLMLKHREDWKIKYPPLPYRINPVDHVRAKKMFLDRFKELYVGKQK